MRASRMWSELDVGMKNPGVKNPDEDKTWRDRTRRG